MRKNRDEYSPSGDVRVPAPQDPVEDAQREAYPPPFTRRDFLMLAAQAGCALPVMVPSIGRALLMSDRAQFSAAHDLAAVEQIENLYSGMHWRMLGPFRAGRVDAVTGVAGRPHEFWFGAVNGGVWKSIDAGRVWTPVFDSQPVASIGAIAAAPSAPDTLYVGTGESTLRDSMGYGNGVYKTTDSGKSWTHLGLDATHHIGRIAVDARNPNIVFVAAIGQLYAANADRGLYKSVDGGRNWRKVLGTSDVGAVDVAIDPNNSQIVYVCLWNTRRPPWYTYAPTNGPGGGIFKSVDGGTTFKQLTVGLPASGIGRSGVAIAPSNSRRVYAIIDCLPDQGGLFRSDDAGATWTKMSGDTALWARGWYFEKVAVDPRNQDIVYVPNIAVTRSKDGGKTWVPLRGSPGGDDYHQAWISPEDPNTMVIASDQGCIITHNAQADDPAQVTWSSWLNQPTAQLYHLSVDYRFPYWVTGAQQDSGAVAVRSRGKFAEISTRDWEPIGAGGESGMTAGDQLNPGIIFGGTGARWDLEANIALPGTTAPRSPETARTDWTQPLVFSRADPHALYYANQFLFKSTDGAQNWTTISPDLTRPEPGVPETLDATAAAQTDRNGKRGVIYSVCPSPLLVPMLWAGTDDGLIHVTTSDGKSWQNVTPAALTSWSRVTGIEASHFDINVAYASVDRHQLQDFEPHIYRTRDMGRTWQRITRGLPAGVYVHAVKEDPKRQGLLFAGTERAVFVSFDDGDNWQPLQLNMPATSMRDLEIYGDDLIVATHGRGFWVIDDISPLRQINDSVLQADAYLFKPADAINYIQGGDNGTPMQKDEPQALNPPNGAVIDYYLKNNSSGPVTIEVSDASGAVLQTFTSAPSAAPPPAAAAPARAGGAPPAGGRAGGGGIPNTSALWRPTAAPFSAAAGMHRVVWNPAAAAGRGGRGGAAPSLTGTFTAKLTVNGQSYTQTFTVRPDPRLSGR